MKGKISKLMMVLAVCVMAFPCLTWADSPAAQTDSALSATQTNGVVLTPLEANTPVQILTPEQLDAINAVPGTESAVSVPRNTGEATGKPCGSFVATDSNVAFTMTWLSSGATYNVQLYKGEIGQGIPVGDDAPLYATMEVGTGYAKDNLEIGSNYYFVVSSNDTKVSGANGRYTIDQY